MDKQRIFKRLKNGKGIESFYRKSNDISYTIRLDLKGSSFQLHTFYVDGNDVFNDESYKDEKIRLFENFEPLIETIEKEFPGLTFNF